ncbi:MAG: polysaccharide deacetylase family protein [Eubacterium sp.]|nr:polysaccharide deacetylase family protein [Eubacterium sp.]
MARKIRIAGLCLVVLIIIAAFSAMSYTQSSTVADISKSQIVSTADTSATLSWKRNSAADGYFVYMAPANSSDFEKVGTVKDNKQTEYKVENLEQATEYQFYVTAYKEHNKDFAESKEYETLKTCTRPTKQKLVSVTSPDVGKLSFEWEINSKALGYQIQYVQGDGKDFTNAKSIDITDKATSNSEVADLTAKETYAVRARTYINYGKEKLFSAWSDTLTAQIMEKIGMPNNIDPNKPMIALTFDDGPVGKNSSKKILDVLEKYNARATFFMIGQNAAEHPENLKRKVKLGCELGNHTWNHNNYGKNVTANDIKKCSEAIYKITGQYPTSFRSPGGATTTTIRNECKAENMPLYYWTLDTQDWKHRNADYVYNAVMKNVKDGDIILMHEIYGSTADAVERMVPELIQQGYQLVTCEELVLAKTGKKPVPGEQYFSATVIKNETS